MLSIVVDANITLRTLLPGGNEAELDRFEEWRRAGTSLFAPDFWLTETVSALRSLVYHRVLEREEAFQGIGKLFKLQVQVVPFDQGLYESAFRWAEHLGQSKIYDGCYLALADRLRSDTAGEVEFWTGDGRLANRAGQIGARWVHQVQSMPPSTGRMTPFR